MPKIPYNKPILLSGVFLLNSQGRSCITPKTSPKIKIIYLLFLYIYLLLKDVPLVQLCYKKKKKKID